MHGYYLLEVAQVSKNFSVLDTGYFYTYRPKNEPYFCEILRNHPVRSKNIFTVYFHGLSPLVTMFVDYLSTEQLDRRDSVHL